MDYYIFLVVDIYKNIKIRLTSGPGYEVYVRIPGTRV